MIHARCSVCSICSPRRRTQHVDSAERSYIRSGGAQPQPQAQAQLSRLGWHTDKYREFGNDYEGDDRSRGKKGEAQAAKGKQRRCRRASVQEQLRTTQERRSAVQQHRCYSTTTNLSVHSRRWGRAEVEGQRTQARACPATRSSALTSTARRHLIAAATAAAIAAERASRRRQRTIHHSHSA